MTQLDWPTVTGVVKPGYQVASGQSKNSPYEKGTLEIQKSHFKRLGLDLSDCYLGTINVSIAPNTFKIVKPKYTFPHLKWHADYPAETFSFSPCIVEHRGQSVQGFVYYPHPETKIGHFQDPSVIEIIAPRLADMAYGDRITLKLNPQEIQLICNDDLVNVSVGD
jgi:hypothetical protein